jgi:hypothetical protein
MSSNNFSFLLNTKEFDNNKIKSKTIEYNGQSFIILNNDSSFITFDNDDLRNYRSVITDTDGKILCFAPGNSIELPVFIQKYPNMSDTESIYANEIIEGTMINLFYDYRVNRWEIATRAAVGGEYWYYRNQYEGIDYQTGTQKTFRQMFVEMFNGNQSTDLYSLDVLNILPKNHTYSFVLQHPDNHIVLNIFKPTLYLVSVYETKENTVNFISPAIYQSWDCFKHFSEIILFPQMFNGTYNGLLNNFCSEDSSPNCLGIMFTNYETGDRAAMSNCVYEKLKEIRGNNPNLQFQFFILKRPEDKQKFLKNFPKYKYYFSKFEKQYQDFITSVHQAYFSYYVKKEGIKIEKKYFIHVSKIHHNIFIPSLSQIKKIINRKAVKEYFDAMNPHELVYYMNYETKHKEKMNIVEDLNVTVTETETEPETAMDIM